MRLSISNPYQNLLISHIILFVLCFIQAIVRALQLEIDVVDKNVLNKNEILSRKYIKEMHKELSNPTIIFIKKKKLNLVQQSVHSKCSPTPTLDIAFYFLMI